MADVLPPFDAAGWLPPGIHAAPLSDVLARFGHGSARREGLARLLQEVVSAAQEYRSIKRVLVWGSLVTDKGEPNDLDYSVVVDVNHAQTAIAEADQRFFVPFAARQFYGTDTGYLVLRDYPPDLFAERLDFMCRQNGVPRGIVEISLRGEQGVQDDN